MPESEVQKLCIDLVKIPSITPEDLGCQDLIIEKLKAVGFNCLTLKQRGTINLLALHGQGSPFFLFLGHTDVVPPGDMNAWKYPPFSGSVADGMLFSRGSADMKGSDAAMTLALRDFVWDNPNHHGTVGLLLTSNEEGDAVGGTPFVAEYLKAHQLLPDYCLVGEPSSLKIFGDQIKNGRRGSLTAHIEVLGVQGHVAYPQTCDNAAHHAADLMQALYKKKWDQGSESFPPSSFQVTNLNCGTGAENVVPGSCKIMCNWRFSDELNLEKISAMVSEIISNLKIECKIRYVLNGSPFITKKGTLVEAITSSIEECCGLKPQLSTSGGTSDGRFIAPLGAQTVEFGPLSASIHKANECVNLEDLNKLLVIFKNTLSKIML